MVHMGCLPWGVRGSLARASTQADTSKEKWSPKAAVRGAQGERSVALGRGAPSVQLGWRDMLWEDRAGSHGGSSGSGQRPAPATVPGGQQPADAPGTSCHEGTRTDGQRAERRRRWRGPVRDGPGVHPSLCQERSGSTQPTGNSWVTWEASHPPRVFSHLSVSKLWSWAASLLAQAAVWGLPSPRDRSGAWLHPQQDACGLSNGR